MRNVTSGVMALFVMVGVAGAQTPNAQVMAPIQKFIDSFNKGDAAGAEATHAPGAEMVIIDEVAPYVWRGAGAFKSWAADLEADAKKQGITDQLVTLGPVTRVESTGDHAYAVVPAVYTFKQGGKAMRAAAHMTFALKKGAGGWLIQGWTWTGPKPSAAPAKP